MPKIVSEGDNWTKTHEHSGMHNVLTKLGYKKYDAGEMKGLETFDAYAHPSHPDDHIAVFSDRAEYDDIGNMTMKRTSYSPQELEDHLRSLHRK